MPDRDVNSIDSASTAAVLPSGEHRWQDAASNCRCAPCAAILARDQQISQLKAKMDTWWRRLLARVRAAHFCFLYTKKPPPLTRSSTGQFTSVSCSKCGKWKIVLQLPSDRP
jgi:ribosomal protein S27E